MKNIVLAFFSLFFISQSLFSQCTDVVFTTSIQQGSSSYFFWELKNSDNTSLLLSDITNDSTVFTQTICLEDGCYVLHDYSSLLGFLETAELSISIAGTVIATYSLGNTTSSVHVLGINTTDCQLEILGCMDTMACNFAPEANTDDGSCFFPGCMDPFASNYDATAGCAGSCDYDCTSNIITLEINMDSYPIESSWALLDENQDTIIQYNNMQEGLNIHNLCLEDGCYTFLMHDDFGDGWNYDFQYENEGLVTITTPSGTFEYLFDTGYEASLAFGVNTYCANAIVQGCTDSTALNYNYTATIDDGSCYYESDVLGCTDSMAINFNPLATFDDGSCYYESAVLGCTDSNAINYNPLATEDDGSCQYFSCNALFYIYQIIEEENTIIIADQSTGEGDLNYLWDFGDGGTMSTEQYPTYYYEETGTYTLCLTISDNEGCVDNYCIDITFDGEGYIIDGEEGVFSATTSGFSINIIPSATLSINEKNEDLSPILIFPVPAKEVLFIQQHFKQYSNTNYQIFDSTGKLIVSQISNQATSSIDVSRLSTGLYTLIWKNEHEIGSKRFSVMQ